MACVALPVYDIWASVPRPSASLVPRQNALGFMAVLDMQVNISIIAMLVDTQYGRAYCDYSALLSVANYVFLFFPERDHKETGITCVVDRCPP